MIAYKHLHGDARERQLRGECKLTLLSHMARQELGDLTDPGEGFVNFGFDGPYEHRPGTEEGRRMQENLAGIVRFEGRAVIEDITLSRPIPDCWILCLAITASPLSNYDACVGVNDVEALALAVQAANSEVLGKPQFGFVKYSGREVTPLDDQRHLDPFRKPAEYAAEGEIRICWDIIAQAKSPLFTRSINDPGRILRRVR